MHQRAFERVLHKETNLLMYVYGREKKRKKNDLNQSSRTNLISADWLEVTHVVEYDDVMRAMVRTAGRQRAPNPLSAQSDPPFPL